MTLQGWLENLTYVVTILGFPIAIFVFVYEQRKQRQNEENGLHRMLSADYDTFLSLALSNADLLLFRNPAPERELTPEQKERRFILYTMLVSLFEKAFIILYDERMTTDTRRLWLSWEDDMREWCRRESFSAALPELLKGEDSQFSARILAIAGEERATAGAPLNAPAAP